jgi:hypothetical protein
MSWDESQTLADSSGQVVHMSGGSMNRTLLIAMLALTVAVTVMSDVAAFAQVREDQPTTARAVFDAAFNIGTASPTRSSPDLIDEMLVHLGMTRIGKASAWEFRDREDNYVRAAIPPLGKGFGVMFVPAKGQRLPDPLLAHLLEKATSVVVQSGDFLTFTVQHAPRDGCGELNEYVISAAGSLVSTAKRVFCLSR